MQIEIAPYAGFCFGVKRAMDMALNEIEKDSNIYSLGPLIHNKQAVQKYEEKGLKVIDDLKDVKSASKIIIRSHGVSLDIYEKAKENNLKIIDTTCPFVKKIQSIAYKHYKEGYRVIIIGDKNHPEVEGINGWCNNEAIIIKDVSHLDGVELSDDKYCIVSQTTMNLEKFNEITKKLKIMLKNVKVHNTICLATKQRQESAKHLSHKVDCMIVVGGKHSSNTQKLVSICSENCKTYAIETADELDIEEIEKFSNVGISAGASTPDWIISDVLDKLKNI